MPRPNRRLSLRCFPLATALVLAAPWLWPAVAGATRISPPALSAALEPRAGTMAAIPAAVALTVRPPENWHHRLAWSLSSDTVLFGAICAVAELPDGAVALADAQLRQILLLARSGALLAVLPVGGEGPGQVTRLAGVAAAPGDGLALIQPWPGRIEVIGRDGTPRRRLWPGGRRSRGAGQAPTLLELAAAPQGWLALTASAVPLGGGRQRAAVRLGWLDHADGGPGLALYERVAEAADRPGLVDETAAWVPRRAWALLRGGRAVVAPERERYRLAVHGPDGRCERILSRPWQPQPRPAAEIALLERGFRLTVNGRARPIELRTFPTAAAIHTLTALRGGEVLATSARRFADLPPGATMRADLIDLAAATVAEVRLQIPLRPWCDAIVPLSSGDALCVRLGYAGLAGPGPQAGTTAGDAAPAIEYWTLQREAP